MSHDPQTTAWPPWQPIETAPTDGTTIFASNSRMGQRGMVHYNGAEWEMVNGLTNYPAGVGFYPTHWVPLPPAPEPFSRKTNDAE